MAIENWQRLLGEYFRYLVGERSYSRKTAREYARDVAHWYRYLETHGRPETRQSLLELLSHASWKPARRNRFLASLENYYRWLRRVKGIFITPPTMDIDRARTGQRLPKLLTPEEVARLAEAARTIYEDEGPYWELLIRFLYGTGLRIGELVSLDLAHVVFRGREPVALRVLGKGNKERILPLSPTAKEALVRWLLIRGRDSGPLWARTLATRRDVKGRRPAVRTVERVLKVIAKKAGIDPDRVTPHVLRHAFATALAEQGADPMVLAEVLGHASPKTTAIYVHLSGRRSAEAVKLLPPPEAKED